MNKSSNAPVGSRLSFAVLNVGHRGVCARARAFARSREKERKREIKKKEIRKIGRNLVGSGNFS